MGLFILPGVPTKIAKLDDATAGQTAQTSGRGRPSKTSRKQTLKPQEMMQDPEEVRQDEKEIDQHTKGNGRYKYAHRQIFKFRILLQF